MNENQKEIFRQIIEQLEDDKKIAQKKLNNNMDRISEININLKTLLDKENYNVNIFSPHVSNIDNLLEENITSFNDEKNRLDEENKVYYKKINQLSTILNNLYLFQSSDAIYKLVPKKNKENDNNSFILLETDRQRIAKDLHDTSLQNLTAIVHKVELASMYINQDPIRAKLELSTISNSLKETINEIRDTIFELRPMTFDDFGFRELLDSYIDKETEKKNIKVIFDKYCLNVKEQSILIFTFRVIKECLGNAVKHSKCSEIHLFIDDSDNKELVIDIKDNGTGFDIEEKNLEKNKHFGLIIMRERVKLMQGIIEMTSNENGTRVHIRIPITNE